MNSLDRSTSWIMATPILLTICVICSAGTAVAVSAAVAAWHAGEPFVWELMAFVVFWSWAALSTANEIRRKRKTHQATGDRLREIASGLLGNVSELDEAIRVLRSQMSADGHTRHLTHSSRLVSAEFNSGKHVVRIVATDGRVSRVEVR